MRNSLQWFVAIFLIVLGGMLFGTMGLAGAGVITGWMVNSSKRGFAVAGLAAAFFWGSAALIKVLSGPSQPLLTLTAALANFSGPKAWLLVLLAITIAFFAGALGGWLGGGLRQVKG